MESCQWYANTKVLYHITGGIPESIGNLHTLETLALFNNSLSGSIPAAIFNISSLQYIGLHQNKFSGTIPLTVSNKLSNLESLFLYRNDLTGVIPNSISNASNLIWLSLQFNSFTGVIPNSLRNLRNIKNLDLASNNLATDSSARSSFLISLTSCRFLRYSIVGDNPLNGFLPIFLNYSTSLKVLIATSCKIKGNIPKKIGNLSSFTGVRFFFPGVRFIM